MTDIELFIPGLLAVPGRTLDSLRPQSSSGLLSRMLERADSRAIGSGRFAPLAEWLRTPCPPLAALHWLAVARESPPDGLLLATPTHFQAGMDDLVMMAPEHVAITPDEAQLLVGELQEFLAGEPALEQREGQWFLVASGMQVSTTPLHAAVGRQVRALLPAGPDGGRVNTWMNEMQMLLHGSRVNAERTAAGRPAINGVWFWGEGSLPAAVPEPLREAKFAGRGRYLELANGLAAFAGGEFTGAGYPAAHDSGSLYVVDTTLAELLDADAIADWQPQRDELLERWLQPALRALEQRRVDSVILYPGDGRRHELKRGSVLRSFWRRLRGSGRGVELLAEEEQVEE